jgi:hypothetical protein
MNTRSGPITTIIRIPRTRWGDEAIFASIDGGDIFYGVSTNASLGAEFEVWAKDSKSRPIGAHKRWVLELSEGYMQGRHDYTIEESISEPA